MCVECAHECTKVGSEESVWTSSFMRRIPRFPYCSLCYWMKYHFLQKTTLPISAEKTIGKVYSWKVAELCAVSLVSWSGPCMRQVEGREGKKKNLLFSLTINEIRGQRSVPNSRYPSENSMIQKIRVPARPQRCGISICKSQIHVERQIDWWIHGQKEYEAVVIIKALTLNFCVKYKHNSQLKFMTSNWRTQSFKLAYD